MQQQWPSRDRPLAIRAINQLGRGLSALGIHRPAIDAASVIRDAKQQTGLEDCGSADFRAGLEQLVASMNSEAALSQIGRVAAKASLVDAMAIRLQLVDYVKKHPAILEEKIERPLFIVGLPRTGTTILHSTVAADPDNRAPLMWEMQRPFPPPTADREKHEPTIVELEKNAVQLDRLAPGFKAIHESHPRLPEECISLMTSAFFQEQFSTVNRLPGYRQWYMNADARPAYEWHKLFLQYLQHHYGVKRWVLKSPLHIPFLTTILEVYPDACVVQTHRDPMKVLGSVCSLICTLRSGFSDAIDPIQVGQEEPAFFAEVLRRGLAQRDAINRPERFYDFQFDDVINRPLDAIGDMYAHFGLELGENARAHMQAFLDNRPRTKHGKHSYTLETFGLTEQGQGAMFRDYSERYVRSVM